MCIRNQKIHAESTLREGRGDVCGVWCVVCGASRWQWATGYAGIVCVSSVDILVQITQPAHFFAE